MFFDQPTAQRQAILEALDQHQQKLIACYCAQWCRTCEAYYDDFKALSQKHPDYVFLWIDVEEEHELLDDLDVENFPTLLIQENGQNAFFGTVLPQVGHITRLLQSFQENPPKPRPGPSALRDLL